MNVFRNCEKPCRAIVCESNHVCPKKCHEGKECGACNFLVKKSRPQCKHTLEIACSKNAALAFCSSPCERTRPFGHKCKSLCSQVCSDTPCIEDVEAVSPCGHQIMIKCSQKGNIFSQLDACKVDCGVELKCGHICQGSCGKCRIEGST